MLALLAGVVAAGALLVWHLQRRPKPPRALSFARFLPDLPEAATRPRRFGARPPLRSGPFWLRMLAVALALAALAVTLEQARPGAERIGLRVVIDVSASMALPEGGGTRLDAALAAARAAEDAARAAAGTGPFCAEGVLASARAEPPEPLDRALSRARARPEGAPVAVLLQAARLPEGDCPLTHVLVVTDLPRPAGAWPEDGARLLWRQVGKPLANLSIADVALHPPRLSGAPARLEVAVAGWGETPEPRVTLDGPGGWRAVPLIRAGDREARWIGQVAPLLPGRHRLRVEPPGAFAADADVAFDLPDPAVPALDWRLPSLPPPRGARAGPGAVLVAPLGAVGPEAIAARPVLLTHDGWGGGASPQEIGAFTEDPVLLDGLNLDAFEAAAPQPLAAPLPPGFVPVLTEAASGRAFAARRADPSGFLVPAPVPAAPEPERALSLMMFFNALDALAAQAVTRPVLSWRDAEGRDVPDAWFESDTARPLAPALPLDFAPRRAASEGQPLWPLAILAALAALLAERLWLLVRRFRGRADVL